MSDDQEAILARHSDGDEPFFLHRVIRIRSGNAEIISEDRRPFFKGYTVLSKVVCGLIWIPLKVDAHSANVPSQSEAIIPQNGWRVNLERRRLAQTHLFVYCSSAESPKCGSNNEPLDKWAAVLILGELLKRA